MARYDAELLRGSIGDAARELKDAALAEFDTWAESAPNQAAGVVGGEYETGRAAAEVALQDVRTLMDDYLAQSLAVVLASWGLVGNDPQ